MGTRSIAQVAPTAATIALNAFIFGYGGHSLVTPHAALKQLWWTDERIAAKVTSNFVLSKLPRREERELLYRPLAFGEGLTDDSYLGWILRRTKRLFLTLAEIGIPDQIFGCIDDSWVDDDLPIPLRNVSKLQLSAENDESLNKKFYDVQFTFLLRELQANSHIDYGPIEHIPIEHANTNPPAVSLQQTSERVHFPGKPDEIYMRQKYALGAGKPGQARRASFLHDVEKAQRLVHPHIASVWASYTAAGSAYILSSFVAEHTLGTFIDHRMPAQLQRVPVVERPTLLLEWMHCLADALASLHHRGAAHTAIRPSNILINRENRIAFADVGSIPTFQRNKKTSKTEIYDYSAPESPLSSPAIFVSSPPTSSTGAFQKLRKLSSSTSSSSGSSSAGGSIRSTSLGTLATAPTTPPHTGRTNSMATIDSALSPMQRSPESFRTYSRHISQASIASTDIAASSVMSTRVFPASSIIDYSTLRDLPEASPEASDIWSLACVFLDIVTFLLKGKVTEFVKHRTTKVTTPPSNSKKQRNDTSFHYDPEKILDWIDILEGDCRRRSEQVYKGVPELLQLIRKMLSQNASLRPTSMEVRDRLQKILVDMCGLETLCCANRDWDIPLPPIASISSLPDHFRDAMYVSKATPTAQSSTEDGEPVQDSTCDADLDSVLARTESYATSASGKRGSSTTDGKGRIRSWRKAFSRSP